MACRKYKQSLNNRVKDTLTLQYVSVQLNIHNATTHDSRLRHIHKDSGHKVLYFLHIMCTLQCKRYTEMHFTTSNADISCLSNKEGKRLSDIALSSIKKVNIE